jgi:hypothetical protein
MNKMKHIFKLILSALLVIILVAGCDTTALHELNIDPNSVNTIDMNYFFTAAELGLASGGSAGDNRYIDWRTNIGMCAHATQQLATTSSGLLCTGDKYIDSDPEVDNAPFQWWLPDIGKNTAEILKQTGTGGFDEGNKVNMRNATRIIRAFNFARLSDMYGNVPYFEANKGIEGIFFPKYDKQKDIYTDCLKELDEATAALSASNPDEGFAAADFVYNGNIARWKKWGYSVMLRLAMRISNVDAAMANTYVTKAIAGGVFTSNDDNFWIKMANGPSEWTNQNGISRAMMPGDGSQGTGSGGSHMAKTLVDFLKGANPASVADDDPRLMIFCGGIAEWTAAAFTPYPGGTDPLNQKGLPNGKDQAMLDVEAGGPVNVQKTYSKMNPLLLLDDSPFLLMNYAEVEFLQAEALERGIGSGITGTAQAHYNAGVKGAMQMYTPFNASFAVTDAQVAAYLTTYPYGGPKAKLAMIGDQLWVSHFMMWFEAWSDWRRTGYPALVPVNYPGNDTNGTIPVRLRLPASEVSGNPNYSGSTLPDEITTKVWWDGGAEK